MNRIKVLLLSLFGVLLIVGAGVATGVVPLSTSRDSARPPCEKLPDKESVVDAVASHEDLVARIQDVGPGVKVDAATPCEGQPDKAIIRVVYETDNEWEGVNDILQHANGFGAPVELVSD